MAVHMAVRVEAVGESAINSEFCRKNDAVSANSTCTCLYCDKFKAMSALMLQVFCDGVAVHLGC